SLHDALPISVYLGAKIRDARVPVGGSVKVGCSKLRFLPLQAEAPLSEKTELCGMIGKSAAARRVFAQLERIGPTDATVLIRGASGTGKDAAARALHALSGRAKEPFIVVSFGSVNPNLIESELFGHARGAFTGADRIRIGAFEAAAGGTIVLDGIAEL